MITMLNIDADLYVLCVQGDLCKKESLLSAVRQHAPDVLFHLASYGMSGREMVSKSTAAKNTILFSYKFYLFCNYS